MTLSPSTTKLRNDAMAALERRNYKKALESYRQLEQLEPTSGEWPRRAADVLLKIGEASEAHSALLRALDRYTKAGFRAKSQGVCTLLLKIDPEDPHAKEWLEQAGIKLARRPEFAVGTQKLPHALKPEPPSGRFQARPAPAPEPAPEPEPDAPSGRGLSSSALDWLKSR